MKIAFLILAHKHPDQLAKLIESLLQYPGSKVFVHVDKKAPKVYKSIQARFAANTRVVFPDVRYAVYWGSYNQVRATLMLLRRASFDHQPDYCCLISGQDFPVRPVAELAEFFKANPEKEYLGNFKLPDAQWENGGLDRLRHYHVNLRGMPFLSRKITGLIGRIQRLTDFKRSINYELYGGSNWFNLTGAAIQYIDAYIHKDPGYLDMFRYSRCADEIFIQSILLNSPFKDNVLSEDLRFVDWSSGPEYPRTFRQEDQERLMNPAPGKFFARKFDEAVDTQIIDNLYTRFGN